MLKAIHSPLKLMFVEAQYMYMHVPAGIFRTYISDPPYTTSLCMHTTLITFQSTSNSKLHNKTPSQFCIFANKAISRRRVESMILPQ